MQRSDFEARDSGASDHSVAGAENTQRLTPDDILLNELNGFSGRMNSGYLFILYAALFLLLLILL